jgi:hypothetical protein
MFASSIFGKIVADAGFPRNSKCATLNIIPRRRIANIMLRQSVIGPPAWLGAHAFDVVNLVVSKSEMFLFTIPLFCVKNYLLVSKARKKAEA